MKRFYVLAVVAAVFALCEVKEILKECPIVSNEWETIHIPHETNPHWFYKCHVGKKYLFKCPLNKDPPFELCYNPELQVCDWPWNVTACMGDTTPTPETTVTPVTPVTTETTVTPVTPVTTVTPETPVTPVTPETPETTRPTSITPPPPIPDPWGCSVTGKIPHPINCKMYYDNGRVPVCCLQHMVFNPMLCACDYPSNVPSCNPTAADYSECGH